MTRRKWNNLTCDLLHNNDGAIYQSRISIESPDQETIHIVVTAEHTRSGHSWVTEDRFVLTKKQTEKLLQGLKSALQHGG